MASQRELSLVVTLQDKASQQLSGLQGKLESMQPMFRNMALYGTAAFAGISVGIGKTIKDAGNAEKIANNFETTFGESSDVIGKFIEDFGDKFAFVESEMMDGANAIGFQLNAMGEISKEEGEKIAKSLLTASGGLSDFFGEEMNVTQAAQALSKGLSGNRAQLQEMGFNVYAEDIKNMAEAMGFNTDELTKAQKAQAFTALIMDQTTGSVGALEENMDSYTAKMRAMRKATKETSETLGELFLPIATEFLNKITPIIEKMAEWVEENPKLTRNIIIATGAIAGIVATLGMVGIVLPKVIVGVKLLGATLAFLAASPVAIVVAALLGVVAMLHWLFFNSHIVVNWLKDQWNSLAEFFGEFWEDMKTVFFKAVNWIIDNTIGKLIRSLERVISVARRARDAVAGVGGRAASGARSIAGSAADAAARARAALPFADGGIVTRPTLGLVGEAGPEAIIPLDQMGKGGTTVNVTVNGDVSGQELIETVKRAIFKEVNRQVKI